MPVAEAALFGTPEPLLLTDAGKVKIALKVKIISRAVLGTLALAGVLLAHSLPAKDITTQVTMVGDGAPDFSDKLVAFQSATTELSADRLQTLAAPITAMLETGAATAHLPAGATLRGDDIHGVNLPSAQAMVQIPIQGGGVVEPSNLSFFIDTATDTVINVIEVQYLTDPAHPGRGRVTHWVSGKVTFDKIVTADGRVSAPGAPAPKASGTQEIQLAFSWKKLNDCLSSHGIAAWAIAAIGVGCAVACAGTLGIGCAVCLSSIGGISAGVATNCVKKAMS